MNPHQPAAENLGVHLLGRRYEADPRDYAMSDVLERLTGAECGRTLDASTLDKTVRQLVQDGTLTSWSAIRAFWRWLKTLLPLDPPLPSPTPPGAAWDDPIVLDQGQTPHCVGFAWAGWGDSAPIQDHLQNQDAHAVYYECKAIDGEPRAENGSSIRSGAKAMQRRGRLNVYAFATSLDDVKQWLATQGPVVFGTDWLERMFTPAANGFVTVAGRIAGGHAYLCLGYDAAEDAFLFRNSWGTGWGQGGNFKMRAVDAQRLLDAQGDACGAAELPA